MDKIHLGGLTCLAKVGVFDWERRIGCPCEINLEISLDLSSAGKSDDLGDTLDYTALYSEIIGLAESCGYTLLERLAEEIAALVLRRPCAQAVCVIVKKKRILGLTQLDYAAVEIQRTRTGSGDSS